MVEYGTVRFTRAREAEPPAPVTIDRDAYVESMSIAQLIARRLDPVDPWRLALVQRHVVWDEVRMSHLLDSVLAAWDQGHSPESIRSQCPLD